MIPLTIGELAKIVDGTIHQINQERITSAIPVIDSRKVTSGTFFCAFQGETVDGNTFAAAAIKSGAEFILTEALIPFPSIQVADVTAALSALAAVVRSRISAKVIGITGSQGKTTAKELLKVVLATQGEVIAPEGSFNNELGVPLTLLRATAKSSYVILEMGARHSGDIAHLSTIAQPDIGVVLVVGTAHLGEFGTLEKLAATKAEMIDGLRDTGIAILGDYDQFTPTFGATRPLKRIIFGEKPTDDVRAADIELRSGRAHFDIVTPDGRARTALRLVGAHHISNALAAAAVGFACGIGVEVIASALSTAEVGARWRMELHEVGGCTLINDTYNANPESMAAALRTAALLAQESGGSCWAFLGKMHELGASEAESHLEIGRLASELHIDHLVEIGEAHFAPPMSEALGEMTVHRTELSEAVGLFLPHISHGDVIVIKASRAEHLDQLAEEFVEALSAQSKEGREE